MTELENKIAVVEGADVLNAKMMDEIGKRKQDETLKDIKDKLMGNGRLMIIGLGGTGKTNAAMHIVRYLMESMEYKDGKMIIRIGDTVNVWKLGFDKIPFIDVTKKPLVPEDEKTVLLDLGFLDGDKNVALLENLVGNDYYSQRKLMDENRGQTPIKRIYVIEEAQNLFGSFRRGGFWLKIWSESRNYGQYFIALAQRLSDVSTQLVERTKWLLIGSLSGQNDLAKIRGMFDKETAKRTISNIQSLRQGEFLFIDRENPESSIIITLTKFEQNGIPYEYSFNPPKYITSRRAFL